MPSGCGRGCRISPSDFCFPEPPGAFSICRETHSAHGGVLPLTARDRASAPFSVPPSGTGVREMAAASSVASASWVYGSIPPMKLHTRGSRWKRLRSHIISLSKTWVQRTRLSRPETEPQDEVFPCGADLPLGAVPALLRPCGHILGPSLHSLWFPVSSTAWILTTFRPAQNIQRFSLPGNNCKQWGCRPWAPGMPSGWSSVMADCFLYLVKFLNLS